MILDGRVRVDGRVVTELGTKANTRAKVEVDGKRIASEQKCYGVLHKPRGVMTTLSDPEGRPTIEPLLASLGVRVVPIGRLDFNTSGALLFTNDGDFAQTLSHARGGAPKVYVAKIQGKPTERALERWRESIEVEGKRTRPAAVRILRQEEGKTWLEVTLLEGRNRQVRRLGEHAGTEVVRLSRLSHAGISVEGVRTGTYRLLSPTELKELRKTYGVPRKISGVMEGGDRFGGASQKSRARPRPLTGGSGSRRPRESEEADLSAFSRAPRRGRESSDRELPKARTETRESSGRSQPRGRSGGPSRSQEVGRESRSDTARGPRKFAQSGPSRGPSFARSAPRDAERSDAGFRSAPPGRRAAGAPVATGAKPSKSDAPLARSRSAARRSDGSATPRSDTRRAGDGATSSSRFRPEGHGSESSRRPRKR